MNLDFTLVNKTGVPLHALHIAPASSDSWEEDLFSDGSVLEDGSSVNIRFSSGHDSSTWDLRVEDSDGNHLFWQGIELDEVSKVTLHYDDGEGTAELE